MVYISLVIQCIFILIFLLPIVTNTMANPVLIDVLWILSITSGVCIGMHQVFIKFKTKSDFKTKIKISISIFLLVLYIFGLGLDKM